MYVYLYDSFVADKKYRGDLARIETRISQLGIQGRIERLSILKNMAGIIRDAARKGTDTIVIVGNDDTMTRVIPLVARERLTIGLIPLGPKQEIASLFGIPQGEAACDVLSKRIIRELDLGRVNNTYFLFSLDIPQAQVQLECDNQYRISSTNEKSVMRICNFGSTSGANRAGRLCNPQDGMLEAVVTEPGGRSFFSRTDRTHFESVFPIRKARIHSPSASLSLVLDGQTVVKTPATVEVAPKRLRVIVGRDRTFQ